MENLAEKSILGTMLTNNYLIHDSELSVDHFEIGLHKNIYQSIKSAMTEYKACDVISLLTTNNPDTLGGANYLTSLQDLSNETKFEEYTEIIVDKWRERKKQNILEVAKNENWPIERVNAELTNISSNRVDDYHEINDMLIDMAEKPFKKEIIEPGANTGLEDLNKMTNGWQNGELIVVAARPSVGKSDFMVHLAKSAGLSKRYIPVMFSLEMSAESLLNRLIASTGGFNRTKMRDPYEMLSEPQKNKWMKTIGVVSQTKIKIFDKASQRISEIRSKVRKITAIEPDKKPLIIIDYLTLIRSDNPTNSRHHDIGEITKALKGIAKEFECPVIVLAQLSRNVEQRQDKRPMLSDIRESGSIEEDADVVVFLYRDEYYDKETEDANTMELIVAKQRNGATGTVKVAYNKFTGALINIDWGAEK
ncbi:hypothetical protein BK128_21395 [Viridibacillus sp. FSL H7-0596]|uniref:replicative DNA helicase n=1 Tax=Viridibacillus sp. FSL H7-0596 TaxID=1928923 RepID=UPI00096C5392|nr:replicative DNA helicase [Viridibacillus sp. FSL H7-0596]OMC81828.1 hypothetical protein BK128_21395 [Viridibacillus sp. FSL H7-0596]